LERGEGVLLLILPTGFRDLLKIDYQTQPDLFALEIITGYWRTDVAGEVLSG
jgi:N-methylhydantoinase A/oxoprolinase/acetone carboxylase beta subunit